MKLFHQFEIELEATQIVTTVIKIVFLYVGTNIFIQFR